VSNAVGPTQKPAQTARIHQTPDAPDNGKSMEEIVAHLNRTLPGWSGYFKYAKASHLGEIDGWIRMRLRSILRKRSGREGRGRGKDHQRWPNHYFTNSDSFACKRPGNRNPPVSVTEQTSDWRAGCGSSSCRVRSGERG
jgi:hypothetical protein